MSTLLSAEECLEKINAIRKKPSGIRRGESPNAIRLPPFPYVLAIFGGLVIFPIWGGISWGIAAFVIKCIKSFDGYDSYHPILYNSLYWGILLGAVATFLTVRESIIKINEHRRAAQRRQIQKPMAEEDFAIYLGESTGMLSRLWHKAGIAPNQNIFLNLKDAAQNILILGAIGSGKTSRAIRPIMLQLFAQGCGGLIFDIKGDVKDTATKFAQVTGHNLKIIGVQQSKINLLAGLTPEIAASFLQSAFLLNQSGKMDGFWIQTGGNLCRNALGVLSHLPEYYNLESLSAYLFDKAFKDEIDGKIYQLLPTLDQTQQRILKSYCRYDEIFSSFDEKVKSGVKATVSQVLAPFSHPELIDAFCASEQSVMDMQDILTGTAYLIDLPLAQWGLGGKVIYTFIKLRFFNLMQNRQIHPEWNQTQPVFFMCDEYQEIVSANKDGLSDLNFWDKARTSHTIGVISGQSVSSFEAAIGDTKLADAIIQNFRQKLCFKTEDKSTLHLLNEIAGEATTYKTTKSFTRGYFAGGEKQHSTTETTTEQREAVIDAQFLRKLPPNQSVALLSVNEHSMDDVINMLAIRLDE